jgi:hypothetical protein
LWAFLVAGFVASAAALTLSLLAARYHPALGLLVALMIAAATIYVQMTGWDFGGAAKAVTEQGSVQICPSGVPSWWPGWAPR